MSREAIDVARRGIEQFNQDFASGEVGHRGESIRSPQRPLSLKLDAIERRLEGEQVRDKKARK